ncbi:MAG: SIMPL domain-containing protein [Lachnospiraceae bacterium]|nr:SIMPL domain-containing protein [Lachnospiraceae bacterium]
MGSENQVNDKRKERGGIGSLGIFFASLVAGLCFVAGCYFISQGFGHFGKSSLNTIGATGSASHDFESDRIVWRGSFSEKGMSSKSAYKDIKEDATEVKNYLTKQGIAENDIVFSSVDIIPVSKDVYDDYGNYVGSEPDGYRLTQQVTIESEDIDKVEKISRDISTLLDAGVEFSSEAPEYYCSTLDEIKLELIEEATENAKKRIEIMAQGSGAGLGKLVNSSLGVFQITARNSGTGDYTYDGYFDSYSRYKTATITVRLEYELK